MLEHEVLHPWQKSENRINTSQNVQLSSYYQYFYQYSVYNRSMLIANLTHDKQGIKLNTQFTRNDHVDIIQAYSKA